MVEGGADVLTSFLGGGGGGGGGQGGLVDVCVVTIAPSFLGNGYRLIQTNGNYCCNINNDKEKSYKNKTKKLSSENGGKGNRVPWLVRLGEEGGEGGREGGGGWHVHRLGRDIVVVGRPQWPRGEARGGEGGAV